MPGEVVLLPLPVLGGTVGGADLLVVRQPGRVPHPSTYEEAVLSVAIVILEVVQWELAVEVPLRDKDLHDGVIVPIFSASDQHTWTERNICCNLQSSPVGTEELLEDVVVEGLSVVVVFVVDEVDLLVEEVEEVVVVEVVCVDVEVVVFDLVEVVDVVEVLDLKLELVLEVVDVKVEFDGVDVDQIIGVNKSTRKL